MIHKIAEVTSGGDSIGNIYLDGNRLSASTPFLKRYIQRPIHDLTGVRFDPKTDPVGWFNTLPIEFRGSTAAVIRDNPLYKELDKIRKRKGRR